MMNYFISMAIVQYLDSQIQPLESVKEKLARLGLESTVKLVQFILNAEKTHPIWMSLFFSRSAAPVFIGNYQDIFLPQALHVSKSIL